MNQDLLAQLMELMAALRMWLTNAPTDPGWWAELWPALVAAALAGLVAVGATAYVQFKLTTHQDEIEREREAEAERRAYTEEARQHVAVPLRETLSRIRRSELTPVDERVRGSVAELLRHRLAAYLPPGGDEIVERWDEAERAIGKADTGRNALRASIAEKRASMRASRTQDRGAAVDTRDLEADDVWRNLTERLARICEEQSWTVSDGTGYQDLIESFTEVVQLAPENDIYIWTTDMAELRILRNLDDGTLLGKTLEVRAIERERTQVAQQEFEGLVEWAAKAASPVIAVRGRRP